MKKVARFWMVWSPQGNQPTRRHPSRAIADTEAARLAKANPGRTFFVLKAVGGAMADAPDAKPLRITGRPVDAENGRSPGDELPF